MITAITGLGHPVAAQQSFGQSFASVLGQLNHTVVRGDQAMAQLAAGKMGMVSAVALSQKASLALDLTVNVQKTALSSYQNVMNMQV